MERPHESERGNRQALWLTLIGHLHNLAAGQEVLVYVRSAVASVQVDPRFDLRNSNSKAIARTSVFCIVASWIDWKASRLPEP